MPPLNKKLLSQLLWFYVGLGVLTLGVGAVIRAGVGAGPWDIFHLGVATQTGIAFGQVVQGMGVVIILLNLALGIKPSLGTVLNMLSVGPMMQFWVSVLPAPPSPALRWVWLAAGILINGIGVALYTSAGIGSGPRDGMMIGLTRRLGAPIGLVKNGLDLIVALVGWRLGGPLGLGTAVVVVCLGQAVQLGMGAVRRLAVHEPFSRFVVPVSLKRT